MMSLVLIPILAGIGLFFWAEQVKDEHPLLALMLQFMFIPCIFLTIHLAVIYVSIVYASNADLVEVLSQITYYFGWLLFGVGVYYCFVVMGKIKDMILKKRAEKQAEKYDD